MPALSLFLALLLATDASSVKNRSGSPGFMGNRCVGGHSPSWVACYRGELGWITTGVSRRAAAARSSEEGGADVFLGTAGKGDAVGMAR